jgi:hypothetical protein
VRSVTRQILPIARPPVMTITGGADAEGWWLRWDPAAILPESLVPGSEDRPMDVSARWAARIGSCLGAVLTLDGGTLLARLPGPAEASPGSVILGIKSPGTLG